MQRLSDGQEMRLWQEEAACGGAQAPRFRGEFAIDAPPREVPWTLEIIFQVQEIPRNIRSLNHYEFNFYGFYNLR